MQNAYAVGTAAAKDFIYSGTKIEKPVAGLSTNAQGIKTGIGFHGARAIFKEGLTVHGLTTGGSICVTAAIGILDDQILTARRNKNGQKEMKAYEAPAQ